MGKAAIIVVLGMSMIITKMLISSNERKIQLSDNLTIHYTGVIARNIAGSGANIALANLSQDPNWRGSLNSNFNGGNFSVMVADTVVGPDSLVKLTATGNYSNTQKTIQVMLGPMSYVIFADDNLKLQSGSGTITGNIHINNLINPINTNYNINGTITNAPPYVDPPTVDWDFFKNLAIAAGQYVASGNKDFTAGSSYTGVWYMKNRADIYDGVVINGTIVAVDKIKIYDDSNVTITATPSSYPAMIGGNKIEILEGCTVTINGYVYCVQDFDMFGDANINLTGSLTTINDFHNKGVATVDFTYDANYTTNLVGITFNSLSGSNLQIMSWQEF